MERFDSKGPLLLAITALRTEILYTWHKGRIVSAGYNLIGLMAPDGGIRFADTDIIGTESPLNPSLNSLANYGGSTQTMALLGDSPAIDQWDSEAARVLDQRSRPRVGKADIGAYERQPGNVVRPKIAVDSRGTLYSAWVRSDPSVGGNSGPNNQTVEFSRSTDQGETWGKPTRLAHISVPVGGRFSLAVLTSQIALCANDHGGIYVARLGVLRNRQGIDLDYSLDGGLTWQDQSVVIADFSIQDEGG